MDRKLLIFGAGEYGQVLKEVAQATGCYSQISFMDDKVSSGVIGKLNDYQQYAGLYQDAIVAIGNPDIRLKWLNILEEYFRIPIIIHPTAYVSLSSIIGRGTIIEPLAVIHTSVEIGKGCIISAGAVINHNAVLGEGVHVDCGCIIPSKAVIKERKKVVQGEIPLQ